MKMEKRLKIRNRMQDFVFRNVHGKRLVYNACWEDPRLDRQLLGLGEESKLVMITSAGCNVLDYLLDGPAEIHTVDVNYRQNALLHLKLALLRYGSYEVFFSMFGSGSYFLHQELYNTIREILPTYAQVYWDDHIDYFASKGLKKSFYYHGTSGQVAWLLKLYILRLRKGKEVRHHLFELLDADTLDDQQRIYEQLEPKLWGGFSQWVVKQPVTMALCGVPRPQAQLVKAQYEEGLSGFVQEKLKHIATQVSLKDNYFWRVYLIGAYSHQCCPNYLKDEHFDLLRQRIKRIKPYTATITQFLQHNPGEYSHFVLLDHQDWLAWHAPDALADEWRAILRNSRRGTKILLRSASTEIDFLPEFVYDAVSFCPERTEAIHPHDRVGTYGSVHLAEVQ